MLLNVIFAVAFLLCLLSQIVQYKKGNKNALFWIGVDAAMLLWVICVIIKAL